MLNELIREIYETSNMDFATAEKVSYAMIQFLERKLPPEEFARIKRYIYGWHNYTTPSSAGYVGYGSEPPDQVGS